MAISVLVVILVEFDKWEKWRMTNESETSRRLGLSEIFKDVLIQIVFASGSAWHACKLVLMPDQRFWSNYPPKPVGISQPCIFLLLPNWRWEICGLLPKNMHLIWLSGPADVIRGKWPDSNKWWRRKDFVCIHRGRAMCRPRYFVLFGTNSALELHIKFLGWQENPFNWQHTAQMGNGYRTDT